MSPPSSQFVRALRSALFRAGLALLCPAFAAAPDDFFREKVQPVLEKRCFECHSHGGKIKGGLALDSRAGWAAGGDGGAVIIPGDPGGSRLIAAVQHSDPDLKMPPKHKLAADELAALSEWVRRGAPDPRPAIASRGWESVYRERLGWWSLQPVSTALPPRVRDAAWPREDVDRFILAALEAKQLRPAPEADRHTLVRRLSFALTGLPPRAGDAERSYDNLVQSLLDSPHFGEHWARHWMDVVHYADTHGYEWDIPAKNAWRYRDYLIRSFNADVSFKQMALEQIAGDLIPPRIDPSTGLNESIIGPMALRLGERRHGDNAMFEGITQEAMANIIDTVSKGFLATTIACAQCHDHKLDAVAQRDYYGLAGVFMSTRWSVRCADAADRNAQVIEELRGIKSDIRRELAGMWVNARESLVAGVKSLPPEKPSKAAVPESIRDIWRRMPLGLEWDKFRATFTSEREKRAAANRANLRTIADFTREEIPPGWQVDGWGMKHGLARDGEIVIADDGDAVVAQVLPAGRWSHLWSPRLAGALRSPMLEQRPGNTFSIGHAGGRFAAQSLIVDHSFHCERMKFIDQPAPGWLTVEAFIGPQRLAYIEIVTKALNNYFPARTGYGKLKEGEIADERSWFGVTKVYQHSPGKSPQDELLRFAPLFEQTAPQTAEELAARLAALVMDAVARWGSGHCDGEDARLINDALTAGLLPNDARNAALASLVARYREAGKRVQPDRTVGSVAEWNEGRDERIGFRGSYTELGDAVPRGGIRFLGGPAARENAKSSGRLELAHGIASDTNPLTARVFVNRVWHHLFGEGLVRTPDDFGHLGAAPSHPELLDYLATRLMSEGWSTKKLVRMLVSSATWRQSSRPQPNAVAADPENRLWHHMPMRRLEGESIRDAILAVSGRFDPALYGPPIDPHRTAKDAAKRLISGPLDGEGRRSLYIKMTLMEPPRFLALFNQPIPKLTTGKRDVTNVPDQALALLNDPFVIDMARHWSERVVRDGAATPEARVIQMFSAAFSRAPQADETERLATFARRSAQLRGAASAALLDCQPVWQDVAHAIFNLKEFIYVP